MSITYLTTDQLAERIHYGSRTIRNCLKDSVLFEGIHYIRPFGGRKLLFIWEAIERDIGTASSNIETAVTQDCNAMRETVPEGTDASASGTAQFTRPRHAVRGVAAIPMAAGGACHV
jgi:hypothetical protein